MAAATATAGAGDLDRSFSGDGKTALDFGRGAAISDVAVTDGRILAAGSVLRNEGGETTGDERDIALARFNRDGSLDRRFGNGGRLTTHSGNLVASSVAIQENGRIVVTSPWGDNFIVMRFLRNGEIDRTFGRRGKVRTDLGGDDEAASAAILQGGRILIAGTSDSRFGLARYRPDGRLDRTFGDRGTITTTFAGETAFVSGLALQAEGEIVVAGFTTRPTGPSDPPSGQYEADFAVARYLPRGTLDAGFAGDGTKTVNFGGRYDFADAVAVDGERIVVAGQRVGPGRDIALAALRNDGSLDSGFSGDGLQTTAFSDNATDDAAAIEFLRDGTLALVGYTERRGERPAMALARYRRSGALDRRFSGDGLKTVTFGQGRGGTGFGRALAVDGQGRLIAGGGRGGFENGDFALARVLP